MIASLITINVIGFMYLYIVLIRLIKKTKFYKRLEELYVHATRVPAKIRTKGDIRRVKKYRSYLKTFRRKLLSMVLVNVAIFMLAYTGMVFSTIAIINRYPVLFVESPVAIPFFTLYDEQGRALVHVFSLLLVAFAAISYPVTRELRLQKTT